MILEQNQIGPEQSGLAQDGQRLDFQAPRHPVEDVIQLARVLSPPYDQGAVRILFDLPLQLPVVALRTIPRRYELEQEASDGSRRRREIVVDPVHVAATEQKVSDGPHPRNPIVPAPPAAKNRGSYFAGVRASIGPKRSRNLWSAAG